jgi:Cu/Ag efflux pump CusA
MFNLLISWSLRNRLLVLAITLILCTSGGYILQKMPVDVFPEFAPPQVVIQTEAPGMAPQDVETLITYPIESAINGTYGITDIRSKTSVGLSSVVVIFKDGSDIYLDRQLVNERLQQVVNRLPVGTLPPVILPPTSAVAWLVKYALTSEILSPIQLRTLSDWVIRPRILSISGVASVVSLGGEVKQYQISLDPMRLLAYRISIEDVNQALENSNLNVPGAFLKKGGSELIVGTVGRIKTLGDIKETLITIRNGIPITIANIGDVGYGGEIKRGDGGYGIENAVIGTISKSYSADTLTATLKVENELQELKATLPTNVNFSTHVFRQANFIESAISNLKSALLEGALIVVIVLFVFLMNWRASLITFISMPISFVCGLLVMYWMGLGINSMTLGGLAIAIGEVVDNGIITVENVVRRLRMNRNLKAPLPTMDVIFDAVQEILNSVVYATIIIILVFLPIFFLSGIAQRIFSPLAIAYIACVLSSLIVAVTMVPAFCYFLLVTKKEKEIDVDITLSDNIPIRGISHEKLVSLNVIPEQDEKETSFVIWIKKQFLRILHWSLNHFWIVVGFAGSGLLIALILLPFFGRSFLPEFQEGNYIIAMTTLPGTSLEESMRLGKIVRENLLKYPQVVSISQRAGRSDLDEDAMPPNFSEFDVHLEFDKNKKMSPDLLLKNIRKDLANIPGAVFNVGQFIAHRMDEILSGVRAQVVVKVYGENLLTLNQLGQSIENLIRTIPGVVDINREQQINVPQLIIKIDRVKAARYGISVGQIGQDVKLLLNGITISSVVEGQRSFDLFVRLEKLGRASVRSVQDMLIDAHGISKEGTSKIPLRAVAQVSVEEQPYSISRENVQRLTVIAFNVEGVSLSTVIQNVQEKIKNNLKLPSGYFLKYGGQFESEQQASRVILSFGSLAVFAAFLLLFKAFGTIREALLVLCNLPLALIGGVISLFIASADMSIAAMIGFITLFGIATRNGIILVTHYSQLRKEGRPLNEVVIQGTLDRLVPVLMTAATATLGLIPLLWGSPVGKELERPLAQVLLGGLFTSTLLNMIVVPTVYNYMELWRERRERKKD